MKEYVIGLLNTQAAALAVKLHVPVLVMQAAVAVFAGIAFYMGSGLLGSLVVAAVVLGALSGVTGSLSALKERFFPSTPSA